MASDRVLEMFTFRFNENDNGGESLTLTTKLLHNGDPEGVYYNQEITLQSYCNSASINLFGAAITPEKLRELANQLEVATNKAIVKTLE